MTELRGMPVVHAMMASCKKDIDFLCAKAIVPKLTTVRVGAREDDLSYERGIKKRFSSVGAIADAISLPENIGQEELECTLSDLNRDKTVHGILLFRPLPKHLSEIRLKSVILRSKDIDCMGYENTAGIFEGSQMGHPPCTPKAVMEILDFYGIQLSGKRVAVIGRSIVVGRPLAMMLLSKDATVTVCHTKTLNLIEECKRADILISCAGKANIIGRSAVHSEQIVIDVGINWVDDKLCGDVDYEAVKDIVKAITPVPGGVGTVTTSILLRNTVSSAMKTFVDNCDHNLFPLHD